MPKKEKKGEKKDKKEDQLSAVDKTYFELTINDLNGKLDNLRTHNAKLEERNGELERLMEQLEEDRADVTAFLQRTIEEQSHNIKDFEEKLSELAKVRAAETQSFQNIIKDWETKFKTMEEQLTSEIKLFCGKLNSLEEFRIQKDELMAKFDQQETNLKEQEQRHKETLYEMERKQIVEKVRLKNELENRLVLLSNEFVKSNEIRIAAHVQRMTRENIALNNELDRLLNTNERLKQENNTFSAQNSEHKRYNESVLEENAQLVNTCKKQVQILTRLTTECEKLKDKVEESKEAKKSRQIAEVRETAARKELIDSKSKLKALQTTMEKQKGDCQTHTENSAKYQTELNRLSGILSQLKRKLVDAISCEDDTHKGVKEQQLLDEFLHILMDVTANVGSTLSSPENDDKVAPLDHELYRKGKIGITPRKSTQSVIKFSPSQYKGRRKSFIDAHKQQSQDTSKKTSGLYGCAIIDVDESMRFRSTDSLRIDDDSSITKSKDDEKREGARKPSMIQSMTGESSSNEEDCGSGDSDTKQPA